LDGCFENDTEISYFLNTIIIRRPMKELPWNFGMRIMSFLPLVSYIISPQMSLYSTNQFKVIVTREGYCVVDTNKNRVKRIARRQDEDMETYTAGKGNVEESDPWDLFQWPQSQYLSL
jgi:hypothetical protein